MGTGASICEKLGGNVEKVQALKVWRRPEHYKLFWSTVSSLFIENSKLFLMFFFFMDEPYPWAWSAFKFPLYVNTAGPQSPWCTSHWCSSDTAGSSVSRGPSKPITQPCKPGTTFSLTSSAPHSSEALPFTAAYIKWINLTWVLRAASQKGVLHFICSRQSAGAPGSLQCVPEYVTSPGSISPCTLLAARPWFTAVYSRCSIKTPQHPNRSGPF